MTSNYRVVPRLSVRLVSNVRRASVAGGLVFAFALPATAQRIDPGPAYATRATLEQELRAGGSDGARLIRARLDSGDFRAGDRILLIVEGEKELSDTFTVSTGTALTLPQIGVVPLVGVLRAELMGRLTEALGRYLRAPVVHVRSLIRVAVEGEVTRPGFYALSPETPLMDALTAAGGLTREARLDKARVERDGSTILSGRVFESAVRSGRTFDGLNLRAGDRVYVPRRANVYQSVQILAILLTVPITIYTATKLF